MRFRALILLTAVGMGCAAKTPPEQQALAECKAHYDILMRWVTAHGRNPETENEIRNAAQLGDKDPWGRAYVVETYDGKLRVVSWGPDGEESEDDICYPPLDNR